MKSKVTPSRFSTVLTITVLAILTVGCIFSYGELPTFLCILIIPLALLICGALYAPLAIIATPDEVVIKSLLRRHRIPMADIESIAPFQPTMGAIRVCGSGGFMGYWGIFSEGDIGRYTAAYGRSSTCLLLRLRDGSKFVIGCDDSDALLQYIRSRTKS